MQQPPPVTKLPLFSRNPFSPEEDAKLVELVSSKKFSNWKAISKMLPGRTARQCRERWTEYLNPNIKYEPWNDFEDALLVEMVQKYGHRWTYISCAFNGRTDNDVKNRWYTHLKSAVYMGEDGVMKIMRDEKGEIVSTKKKRKRRIVCANQNAFQACEQRKRQAINFQQIGAMIPPPFEGHLCIPHFGVIKKKP